MRASLLGLVLMLCALTPSLVKACDLCAVYSGTTRQETRPGFSLSLAQQYTSFNTLELNDKEIGNFDSEWMQSSISQFVLGYGVSERLRVQLTLPLIYRSFRRVTATGIERGREEGVGDVVLAAQYAMARKAYVNSVVNWTLLAGVKLPTGHTGRLGEESTGESQAGIGLERRRSVPRHDLPGGSISGVHGHDLALGSGSVDLVVGTNVFASWRRAFVSAGLQYLIRGKGDYGYRYANDLQFDLGPGIYLLLDDAYTLAVQARLSGQTKGKDRQQGQRLHDTSITAMSLGPNAILTWSDRLHAELGFETPLFQNTTDLQIVADYRVRSSVVWRF